MICKCKSIKLNSSKYCYVSQHQSFIYTQLNDQTVLFQTIHFSIHHLFALSLNVKQFYLTHIKGLSGAPTLHQSGRRSNGNERVLCIPQNFNITVA